jgi:hypothetical protein
MPNNTRGADGGEDDTGVQVQMRRAKRRGWMIDAVVEIALFYLLSEPHIYSQVRLRPCLDPKRFWILIM